MKTITLILALCISTSMVAQPASEDVETLEITFNKTSSLLFSSVIKTVDRGSPDVLAQVVKGSENVLQLKAAVENFQETNLTVITSDGLLHEFRVLYSEKPDTLFHTIGASHDEDRLRVQFQSDITEEQMNKFSKQVLSDNGTILRARDRSHRIKLTLNSIYVYENVMLFKLGITNRSNINYDIDYMRFFIKDKTRSKRSATQEVEMKPIFLNGNFQNVKGQSTELLVLALEKFTIPDAKRFTIEFFEHNGGRHLKLKIKNRRIVRARLI